VCYAFSDSPDNHQVLSAAADVTSLIVEGIAQNTSGSILSLRLVIGIERSIDGFIRTLSSAQLIALALLIGISVLLKIRYNNSNPYVHWWSYKRCT
jgi:hypothetical protein